MSGRLILCMLIIIIVTMQLCHVYAVVVICKVRVCVCSLIFFTIKAVFNRNSRWRLLSNE